MSKISVVLFILAINVGCNLKKIDSSNKDEIKQEDRSEKGFDLETGEERLFCAKEDLTCSEDINCTTSAGIGASCVQGVCVTDGPGCIYDSDCFDNNPCIVHTCEEGICKPYSDLNESECIEPESGLKGICAGTTCVVTKNTFEENVKNLCNTEDENFNEEECVFSNNSCMKYDIKGSKYVQLPNGTDCENNLGAPGKCQTGYCRYDDDIEIKTEVKCGYKNYYNAYGQIVYREKRCRNKKGMQFKISNEELKKASSKLKKSIMKNLRYDVHVGIVHSHSGGYNIIITNTNRKDKVRGMIDPSLVAWEIAEFTRKTNWRSANLQVWTRPRHDGWHMSTSGSRKAVRKGQAGAGWLGMYGVVNVRTFRVWLEKNFKYIEKGY
jgi:hypothetical protein